MSRSSPSCERHRAFASGHPGPNQAAPSFGRAERVTDAVGRAESRRVAASVPPPLHRHRAPRRPLRRMFASSFWCRNGKSGGHVAGGRSRRTRRGGRVGQAVASSQKGKSCHRPPRLRSDCPQEHKAKRAARRANVLASCMRIFRFSSSRAQDGLSGRKRTLDPASSCLLLVSPPPPPRLRTNPLANAWSKASTSRTSRDQRLERVY